MVVEINFRGANLEVEGEYYEGDEGRMYYSDMSGQPPTPSEFEVECVRAGGVDITELVDDLIDDICEACIDKIEDR